MDDAEGRFRVVFESTYPALVRYVRHRGLSGADADDLVAGTYEVAWRRWEKVPTDDGALPWLLAVARNLLRNRWRTQLRERAVLERLGPPQEDGWELLTVSWQDIRGALDRDSRGARLDGTYRRRSTPLLLIRSSLSRSRPIRIDSLACVLTEEM